MVCVCVCARDGPFSFSVLTSVSFASVPFFLCSYYYYISIIRYWSPKQVFVEPEQLRKDVVECPQLYSFEKKVDLSYWYIAFLFFCSFYYPLSTTFSLFPQNALVTLRKAMKHSKQSVQPESPRASLRWQQHALRRYAATFFFSLPFFFLCGELFSLVGVVQPLFFFFFSSFLLFFFLVYK